MPKPGFVNALWVGPFNGEAVLQDGTRVALESGVTVVEIPKGEAEDSAFWDPKGKPRKAADDGGDD